jgi:hypothetical protein
MRINRMMRRDTGRCGAADHGGGVYRDSFKIYLTKTKTFYKLPTSNFRR